MVGGPARTKHVEPDLGVRGGRRIEFGDDLAVEHLVVPFGAEGEAVVPPGRVGARRADVNDCMVMKR